MIFCRAGVSPALLRVVDSDAGSAGGGLLVLLDANPLAGIRNTRRIAGVMIGRHWIDRAGIEQILMKLRKR